MSSNDHATEVKLDRTNAAFEADDDDQMNVDQQLKTNIEDVKRSETNSKVGGGKKSGSTHKRFPENMASNHPLTVMVGHRAVHFCRASCLMPLAYYCRH